jgi:serine/threonine protein kinase
VYEIEAHCEDAADNFAMKIVMNFVDLDTREDMYGRSNSGFNTNIVRNRQSNEYLIPTAFSHPLIVSPINSWIGDINDLAEDYPNVLNLKQSLIGMNADASIVSRTSFLVMPLYRTTLSTFFKQTTPEIQAYIFFQLLEVVNYLQENYVIHSDFRGDNILVIGNDIHSVKIGLADFGQAKALCHQSIIPDRRALITFTNEMNQYYLPPELKVAKFSGMRDAWSYCCGMDIWSCGITILELYSASTEKIKSAKTKTTREREVSVAIQSLANRNRMPGPVQEICRLLLAFDPKDRNLQRARMLAGRFCWPDVVCDDSQLQEAKTFIFNNPYSRELHKLLKFKFMAEYSAYRA